MIHIQTVAVLLIKIYVICDLPDLVGNVLGLSVSNRSTLIALIVVGMYMQTVDDSDVGVVCGVVAYTIYICLSIYRTMWNIARVLWMAIKDKNRKSSIIAPCENMKLVLLQQTKKNLFNEMGEVMRTLIDLYNTYKDYEFGSEERIAMASDIDHLLNKFDKLNIQHDITQILIDEETQ